MISIENTLSQKEKYIILYFTASWCGPCRMFKNILESFSNKYKNEVEIIKIDVDERRELAIDNHISSVPTLIFYKNGKIITRKTGVLSLNALEDIVSN